MIRLLVLPDVEVAQVRQLPLAPLVAVPSPPLTLGCPHPALSPHRTPDASSDLTMAFVRRFISAHARQAMAALKKPLLLEEFSAVGTQREELYKAATELVMSTPVHAGMHVWQLTLDDLHLDSAKPKSIAVGRESDAGVVAILRQHAKDMAITAQQLPRRGDVPHEPPVSRPALLQAQPGTEARASPAQTETAGARLPVGAPQPVTGLQALEQSSSPQPALVVGSRAASSASELKAEVERLRAEVAMLRHTLAGCKGGAPTPQGGSISSIAPSQHDMAPVRHELSSCSVEWGAWVDGQLLHSASGLTLPSCCELCQAFPGCEYYNSAGGSEPRCLLLGDKRGRLEFTDPGRVASSATGAHSATTACSCAGVGVTRFAP